MIGEGTEEEEGVMHFWKDKMESLIHLSGECSVIKEL